MKSGKSLVFLMLRCAFSLFLVLGLAVSSHAQRNSSGNFTYSAAKLSYRANGVRLDGAPGKPARISSPDLEVVAGAIAFDIKGNTISQVRAIEGVDLKVNLAPQGGGEKVRVESRSQKATLTTNSRTLELDGNLSGFYQLGGGAKNTLAGESATISYAEGQLAASVSGGKEGVELVLPAESVGQPGALGALRVTGRNLQFDGSTGRAILTGNARVVSTGGEYTFDVAAPSMTLLRKADGTLERLATSGRTMVKLDLPPEPSATPAADGVGRPTRVEVASDSAIVERANMTGTFSGNVKGFYRLQNGNAAAQNFDFSGDKAVIAYASGRDVQSGLNVEVTGNVAIETPNFGLVE